MLLFLESANLQEIRQAVELRVIDGVFVSPTLARQVGAEYSARLAEVCQIAPGSVTAEVTGHFPGDMLAEAEALAAIDPRIIIKLPATRAGMRVLKHLSRRDGQTNIALCFSPAQALIAAKAGASSVTLMFGADGDSTKAATRLITKTRRIFDNYSLKAHIITGPIQCAAHLADAAVAGADAAVIRAVVIDDMLDNPRTDQHFRQRLAELRTRIAT